MDMKETLIKCMKTLAVKRPVFHSEADFQFCLAFELKNTLGDDAKIYCEYPVASLKLEAEKRRPHLDILISVGGKKIPIELKYRPKASTIEYDNEVFELKPQGDNTWSRYDFLKDVLRIENYKNDDASHCEEGYAIFLTDNMIFKEDKPSKHKLSLANKIEGEYYRTYINEKKQLLEIKGIYTPNWHDYRDITDTKEKEHTFKYLMVEVK
ncbi:hypothetical protein M2149_001835 [Lachnospiraceae bacterium PFB1-21]